MAHGVMIEEMHQQGTTLRRYQTCRRQTQRATNKTRKEGLKSYADMTIYAVDLSRLVPKMCHHKLRSYNYISDLTNTQQCLIHHSLFSG